MNYIAVFFTHSGAVKYNRFLKSKGTETELMPVPRKLSSNCGIGVDFVLNEGIKPIISEDIEKIFIKNNKDYKLVYSCD